jgi:serine/threonine protein kinase
MHMSVARVIRCISQKITAEQVGNFILQDCRGRTEASLIYKVALPDGRPLAVKLPSLFESANFVQTATEFLNREAEAHEYLDTPHHPNIVEYYGHGEIECEIKESDWRKEQFFLAMEFVEGTNVLRAIGQTKGELSLGIFRSMRPTTALPITLMIAEGLKQVHNKGWVHADVKPGNVMLERNTGLAKLFDFSFARPANTYLLTEAHNSVNLTEAYASKWCRSGQAPRTSSDIFSLGVSLFEMLCGGIPFFWYSSSLSYLDYESIGPCIEGLRELGLPRPIVQLLYNMTGTTGEYGVYEQGGFEHAEQVVDYIKSQLSDYLK